MDDVIQTTLGDIVSNHTAAEEVVFDFAAWVGWAPVAILTLIGVMTVINKFILRR